jgi:hypothetical protein
MPLCFYVRYDPLGPPTVRCPACKVKRRLEVDAFSFGGILTVKEMQHIFASEELVLYAYHDNMTYTYSMSEMVDLYLCCMGSTKEVPPETCSTSHS